MKKNKDNNKENISNKNNFNNQEDEKLNLINEKEKNDKNRLLEIFERLKTQLNDSNKDIISEAYSQEEKEYMKNET